MNFAFQCNHHHHYYYHHHHHYYHYYYYYSYYYYCSSSSSSSSSKYYYYYYYYYYQYHSYYCQYHHHVNHYYSLFVDNFSTVQRRRNYGFLLTLPFKSNRSQTLATTKNQTGYFLRFCIDAKLVIFFPCQPTHLYVLRTLLPIYRRERHDRQAP